MIWGPAGLKPQLRNRGGCAAGLLLANRVQFAAIRESSLPNAADKAALAESPTRGRFGPFRERAGLAHT
jgi:hypothetical protein